MSILIKGMEMPENCWDCAIGVKFNYFDSEVLCPLIKDIWIANECNPKCPLVSVPPHGRLIDADEFLKRAIGTKCFHGDIALMLEELVGESTTIIPPKEET